jgi:hypothetical protein
MGGFSRTFPAEAFEVDDPMLAVVAAAARAAARVATAAANGNSVEAKEEEVTVTDKKEGTDEEAKKIRRPPPGKRRRKTSSAKKRRVGPTYRGWRRDPLYIVDGEGFSVNREKKRGYRESAGDGFCHLIPYDYFFRRQLRREGSRDNIPSRPPRGLPLAARLVKKKLKTPHAGPTTSQSSSSRSPRAPVPDLLADPLRTPPPLHRDLHHRPTVGGDLAATHRPPLALNPALPNHYVDLPPPPTPPTGCPPPPGQSRHRRLASPSTPRLLRRAARRPRRSH